MRHLLGFLVVGILLTLLTVPAFALRHGLIVIGNEQVMRVRFPAGGMSVQQRTNQIDARVNEMLGSDCFDATMIRVSELGGNYAIVYGKNTIVTVDEKTAGADMISRAKLARTWAANLRRVVPLAKGKNGSETCEIY